MAEFVLGCVQLGLAYGAANRTGKPSHAAALRLLRRAVASGIQTYDVARAYGDAEDRLGEALSDCPVGIITKLSPLSTIPDDASADQAVMAVEASIVASREALRRNRLDCLLLHRAAHRTLWAGAAWQRLLDYRSEGVITRLGISAQSAVEAEAALADPDVQHIQMPFNLLDWRWGRVLALCAARPDVTVHVRSVFLQGLLAANDAALWPSIETVDAVAVVTAIGALVRDLYRDSAADLCLAYVRGQAEIHGLVIGLETEEQLEANLALFAKPPLSAAECAIVKAALPCLPEQILNPALWPKT
ncbi:MAG: aldo/keto reductase [Rhizomicrobium sp.]|nr:aldo/keto reductase [Rhizomicrobium sp.]